MSALDKSEVEALIRTHLPQVDHRGEVIERLEGNELQMRLPMRPEYLSQDLPPGSGQIVVSAPIMMGLADTAMYAAIHALYGRDAFGAIVSLNVSFLRIAPAEDLVARVRLLKKGKALAFLEVDLSGVKAESVSARVTATYSIWKK
jgi:acyl-coenzyme A thioesterase PaaI-like protein